MKKYAFAAVLALSFSTAAHAANGCWQPKTGFDNVYCFAKVFMDLDRQLNESYQSLMRRLDPTQKDILRDGQREWIVRRDQECHRTEGSSDIVNITCALSSTRKRILFLSDRLAECRAHGCNRNLLGSVSESEGE
jgi:uncharacterized protein YecT (DUF1311 family)